MASHHQYQVNHAQQNAASSLSPARQATRNGSFGLSNPPPFYPAMLARTGSSSSHSNAGIGVHDANSIGGHSRESSHSQGIHPNHHLQRQSSQQSLGAASAASAALSGRFNAAGRAGSFGAAANMASPTPSRSSFGADSSHGGPAAGSAGSVGHATSGFMARPSMRSSLSDGFPSGLNPSDGNSAFTPPLYSSASGNGSTSNLSATGFPSNLSHTTVSSNLRSTAPSVASPSSSTGITSAAAHGMHAHQAIAAGPPSTGPLGPNNPRTSLLVLNLPSQARWQDLKDLFRRSAGTVLRADVSLDAEGVSRGVGSVLMRHPEDAKRALECFNGFEWMGNRLEVMIERGGGGGGWEGERIASGKSPVKSSYAQNTPHMEGLKPALPPHRASFGGATEDTTMGGSHSRLSPFASSVPQQQQQYGGSPSGLGPHSRVSFSHFSQPKSPLGAVNDASPQQYAQGQHAPNNAMLAPPSNFLTPHQVPNTMPNQQSHLSPLPPHQAQQLRAASFSAASPGGARRPSQAGPSSLRSSPYLTAQHIPDYSRSGASMSARPSISSPNNLPTPPFPPPAPSPSANTNLAPGSIPTQHQLAVLSAQAAQAAVAAQQAKVVAQNGGMPQGSYYGRTLFVGNLSYATQWQDLKDLFRSAGNIVRADIAMGSEGRSRGFGTALFATKEEAARAVRMFHGYDHNGRSLKVHFDRFARMECPPPGLYVPARVEDYTSAFNAAQPPSNVGNSSGATVPSQQRGSLSGGPSAPSFQQQSHAPALPHQQQHNGRGMTSRSPNHYYMSSNQAAFHPQQQQYADPAMNVDQGNHLQYGQHSFPVQNQPQYMQHYSDASYADAQAGSIQQQPPQALAMSHFSSQSPYVENALDGDVGNGSRKASVEADATRTAAGSAKRDSEAEGVPSQSEDDGLNGADANATTVGKPQPPGGPTRVASSGAHPGKIQLPSPPTMAQGFAPYQSFGHASGPLMSPTQGMSHGPRAPMPMTPGMPLTPGMPGFTMGGIPPPTPPAFQHPFMGSAAGMMSPGIAGYEGHPGLRMMPTTPGAGPPTPWQIPGMSAAPGGPLRMVHPSQMTPRGGSGPNGSTFNPFFANAVGYQGSSGMPQTPHWNVNPRPPQQRRRGQEGGEAKDTGEGPSEPAAQHESTSAAPSSAGPVDESALSSRSASPAVAPLKSDAGPGTEAEYPFPALDFADKNKSQPPSSSGAVPGIESRKGAPQNIKAGTGSVAASLPPSISHLQRRASTNSPAVSPGVFGGGFGGVNGGAGESNTSFGYFGAALANAIQRDGPTTSEVEREVRERRPSLGVSALRTPAAEIGASAHEYFPSVIPASDNGQGKESNTGDQSVPASSSSGVPTTPLSAGGHPSTEAMARAIAKMSIEGTALKRTISQQRAAAGGSAGSAATSPNVDK